MLLPGTDGCSFVVSPVDSDPGHGLVASCLAGVLTVRAGTWLVARLGGDAPVGVGVVFGLVTAAEAVGLVQRLLVDDDPGHLADGLPWAAAVVREDDSLVATASTLLASGLFVAGSPHADVRVVATDPLRALATAGLSRTPDWQFLRAFLVMRPPVVGTPFEQVRRVPAGDTLRWGRAGEAPTSVEWCGPATVPRTGRRADAVAEYLSVFDRAVARLVERAGPVSTTLSGGLDSGFMVASLVRAVRGRAPVHAYCHSPLVEARAAPIGQWDPDDWPYAQAVAEYLGPTVRLHRLRNDSQVHPLDVAREVGLRRGWPVSAPGNAVWMDAFSRAAAERTSVLRFYGTNGNAALSYSHPYAARHHLRRRQWRALWRLTNPSDGRGRARAVRAQLRRWNRIPAQPSGALVRWLRPEALADVAASSRQPDRDDYLRWLTARRDSLPAGENPAAYPGVLAADPFRSRRLMELAASIEPAEWQQGYADRAFARRVSLGRLPDEVRLRRRRGAQAFDTAFVVTRNADRALDAIASTPSAVWDGLGVNQRQLYDDVRGSVAGEEQLTHGEWLSVLRIAAVGEFLGFAYT